ncbi:MAG: tRNA (5-methylaminomethyl-2-thiouridine)(34)-methyltransferase MnmD [Bacteroidetes bacterium]|nr:tRNA (5-methylaminomethyl-2-thiouridine)(34)-methyltransferase MnmD [Bacteroidota bacterium]
MKPEIIQTADGSHSLYLKELDEHYHSVHGAIQEGIHVFIKAGLQACNNQHVSILEIGLGTGLNALLTLMEVKRSNKQVHYTAIEAFPLEEQLINQLNYVQVLKAEEWTEQFQSIHACPWGQEQTINKQFTLFKLQGQLQTAVFPATYDLIYFDAFGPRVQPEMWTEEIFSKMYAVLNAGGMLVTYCAKGEVKRTLKKVGFMVETLPGPPGKREMVRARKEI